MKFYRDVVSRTLENGVRIFVCTQPGTAVEVECFVRTGSIHEGERLGYGLSHFLEHMLFQGCRNYPGTAAADAIDRLGGSMNAYTSYDHTAYHANLSGRYLAEAVDILGSMVRYPEFPEKRLAEERDVILREEELGRDNPDRQLYNRLTGSIFQVHPLRHPIIGYRELIAEVNREIMVDYYEKRYTPDRCFWVIVGGIEAAEAFDLVEQAMGDWQRRHLLEPAIAVEPRQCVARSEDFIFADPLSRLAVGVRIPEVAHEDTAACDVLSGILGLGDGSRLVRRLEHQAQLALHLRSFSYSQNAGGMLAVTAACTPAKLRRLERALLKELEEVRGGGLTRDEVEREKVQQLAEHLRELRGIREIAANIGGGVIANGSPELSDNYLERLNRLTLEDVQQAAAKYLQPEHFSVIRQLTATATAGATAHKVADELKPELHTLENGARLVTVSDRRLPLVDFAVVLPGGTIFEDAAHGGISGLAAELLTTGTRRYRESELLKRLDAAGANLSISAGMNSMMIDCTCPRRYLNRVLPLLKEIIAHPTFPRGECEREKKNKRELLKSRALSPRAAAEDLARKAMFGSHPYSWGTAGTPEQLEATGCEAVQDFYFSRWVPEQVIFGWGGDCSAEEALLWTRDIAAEIDWRSERIELPPEPVFPTGPHNLEISLPREQTVVGCAVPAPRLYGRCLAECEILFQAENGLSSPIFKLIREENSLAYSTGMRLAGGFHPGWLMFYAITTAESAGRALELIDSELRRLAEKGLTREEFEAAKEGAAFAAARSAESASSSLSAAMLSLHYGLTLADSRNRESELRAVKRAAMKKELSPYLANPAVIRIMAGKLPESSEGTANPTESGGCR